MTDDLLKALGIPEEEILKAKKAAKKDIKDEIGDSNRRYRSSSKKTPKV